MNIAALKNLTPQGVVYASRLASSVGRDDMPLIQEEWRNFCMDNSEVIIAALHAALAYKRELEQTHGT
jgi:hypothetical protein